MLQILASCFFLITRFQHHILDFGKMHRSTRMDSVKAYIEFNQTRTSRICSPSWKSVLLCLKCPSVLLGSLVVLGTDQEAGKVDVDG